MHDASAQCGNASSFIVEDVCLVSQNHLPAPAALRKDCEQICLRTQRRRKCVSIEQPFSMRHVTNDINEKI